MEKGKRPPHYAERREREREANQSNIAIADTPDAGRSSQSPALPLMLNMKDAAAYTGMPVWAIRQAIWSGQLPVIKSRGYMMHRHDLDAWLYRTKKTL